MISKIAVMIVAALFMVQGAFGQKAGVNHNHHSPKANTLVAYRLPDTAVRKNERDVFNARRKYAAQSEVILRKHGAGDKEVVAALANAWHECRWNPKDVTGVNVGMYQLSSRGMGSRFSVRGRQNVELNTIAVVSSPEYAHWLAWSKKRPKATMGELAYEFAVIVERPAFQHRSPRRITGNRWGRSLYSGGHRKT